ncbi:MAG: hypothetical protein JNL57_06725 [Bacteroidetes bacterium]|nr:hypothetical protein [Bacteroidota bacterium]
MKERKPNRLKGFDYATSALYFITSCVQGRINCFGKIHNGEMHCSPYGKIAQNQWEWLQQQYTYIVSHAFVVMPDHIHAVIEITNPVHPVGSGRDLTLQQPLRDLTLQQPSHDLTLQDEPTKIKSLSELIGAYKTTTSKCIHQAGFPEFKWQRSFHDHIIRNAAEYQRIIRYILTNPQRWNEETLNTTKSGISGNKIQA